MLRAALLLAVAGSVSGFRFSGFPPCTCGLVNGKCFSVRMKEDTYNRERLN